MFTGIIEEIGEIRDIIPRNENLSIEIRAARVLENTKLGDSIAVNGVCLTVCKLNKDSFIADVMGETYRRTNLKLLKKNSKVNLERALSLSDRLGGHIVSGHVDGLGRLINKEKENISTWLTIQVSTKIAKYIVEKGSITIDGVSLTVARVDGDIFKVSIIPHTSQETTILSRDIGYDFNIENDIVGKYVEKLLGYKDIEKKSNITEDFLMRNGFM